MRSSKPSPALLIFAALNACFAWPLAGLLWFRLGERAFATSLFLLGLSLGPSLAAYALVPTRRKQPVRRVVLFTGGLSIMAFAVLGAANLDLEGFFMLLFKGTMGAAIGHTLITVIVGPVFFGRFLCGWGCWRSMILELLPLGRGRGRRGGAWKLLPFAGLAASIAGAAISIFVFGHHPGGTPGAMHAASVRAILFGFAIYYAASIGLAFLLNDQRAFCKYLCPSSVILGLTGRLAILKMTANRQLCNACGACTRVCPMDIDVAHFAEQGRRVASGQCILCQSCAHACPTGALRLAPGFAKRC
jgi:ferredoxin